MKHSLNAKLTSIKKLLFLSFIFFLVIGCYPEGGEYVEDFDVVYTNYTPDFNFNASYTYSLPDAVIDLAEGDEDSPEYIDNAYSDAVLNTLRTNLDAMGWTEVSVGDNPEIVVIAAAFNQTFISYSPGWWDWYYPWLGPGWGWYYPGYSPGYISGYSTGSVLVQMTYPENTTNDNEVPVVWLGALNGLLQGGQANIASRITSNLNQAFNQPPFNN